ncbi:MAG TPA: TfuA-like protein [Polyangiales bacterium]|nr:TfuA-like protein [Polyangiales bacterium]
MNTIVFVGPTLAASEARGLLDADYRPPAAQGDVYRAALERPWGIAIVDGYFERVPAVWHKEVLWALDQGIHVFGSSSMGALRGAELHSFGMIGVGSIFEDFRDGILTDDDEVTVVHADAQEGYRPLSTALVDMRATLQRALRLSVIDCALVERLLELAKQRHYAERSYPRLYADALDAGLPRAALARFRAWVLEHAVPQKKLDAQLMLRRVARWRAEHPNPRRSDFEFEYTDTWHKLTRRIQSSLARSDTPAGHAAMLETLRGQPDRYAALKLAALSRKLGLMLVQQLGLRLSREALNDTILRFRSERALYSAEATSAWCAQQDLERGGFLELMEREAALRLVRETLGNELEDDLIDELRASGAYAELATRARTPQLEDPCEAASGSEAGYAEVTRDNTNNMGCSHE